MYQILSQSVRFCRLYIKNISVCFFGSQCILAPLTLIVDITLFVYQSVYQI